MIIMLEGYPFSFLLDFEMKEAQCCGLNSTETIQQFFLLPSSSGLEGGLLLEI